MRKQFTLTKEQHEKILDASGPVPYLLVSGGRPPPSPQEIANAVWEALGIELGFEYMSVRPVEGTKLDFTAEVTEKETE